MVIDELMVDIDAPIITKKIASRFADLRSYFANHPSNTIKAVDPGMGDKHIGDFFGLLRELQIPSTHFTITLAINNFTSPQDYDGSEIAIIIPSSEEVTRLYNTLAAVKI